MLHRLKIDKEHAIAHFEGRKPWEVRKNDRNFQEGELIEFTIKETGFQYIRKIIFIYLGSTYGLKTGFCILTIE